MRRTRSIRSQRGIAVSLILLGLILGAFLVTALAVDVAHGVLVRSELQTACDAGALAGAQDLVETTPTTAQLDSAYADAVTVTGRNVAELNPVSNSTSGVTVSAIVAPASPYTVTVQATKTITNMFAALFGNNSSQVSARAVALAQPIQSINPGQMFNLAVSLDWSPPKGPQAGRPLSSYVGPGMMGQSFTVDLNSQQDKNAAWIKDWSGSSNPYISFGQTVGMQNGVEAKLVQDELQPGDTVILPIIEGGPPFNDSRTLLGAAGFKITSVNFPQQITGTFVSPIAMMGKPGTAILPGLTGPETSFLNQNQLWQVQLVQ